MRATRGDKFGAYAAWLAVCFFWGTTYLAIRVGLETMPPMLLAALRFLTAGGLLMGFVALWRGERLPRGRDLFDLSLIGLLLLGVGNGIVVWAEQWISSGMAALLVATSPFWVVFFERLRRNGERVKLRTMIGLLIGFAGLALLVAPSLFGASFSSTFLIAMLGIQLGCAAWTGGSIYSKQRKLKVSPLMGSAVQMLVAGMALLALGTFTGEWGRISFTGRSLAALSYLIVFGSIIAYGSYTYAIQKLPLSLVSMYSYINPVIAVLLGWAVLAESLTWRVGVAALIILAGVALVQGPPKFISWSWLHNLRRVPERPKSCAVKNA